MRFAAVGDSASVTSFLQAVAEHPDHELAALALAPELYAALKPRVPSLRLCRTWEELLSDQRLDALVVAGDDDEALCAARQFAAAGKALLVGPTVGLAATFAYELTLLQADQPVRLVPLFIARAHPLVARLKGALAEGRIGTVQHVLVECRIVPASAAATTATLFARDIAGAFLPDADLLRSIWGEFDTVTAVRTGDSAGGISLSSITLAGPGAPQVVWSAAVADTDAMWRLTVVGSQGTAALVRASDGVGMHLETSLAGRMPESENAAFDGNAWLLAQFPMTRPAKRETGVAVAIAVDVAGAVRCPNWEDFTRAVELLEAAERSVRRRRTIEIQFETHSERGQFKTQMTAAGCSLLTLTLIAVVVYLTANALVDLNIRVKQVLVALIFLPLGVFLALQGLLFLARPAARQEGEERESRIEDRG